MKKITKKNIQLKDDQIIKDEIEYTAPDYLKGDYELWLFAKNDNSLSLALFDLGKVTLNGSGQYLQIANDSCYFTVGDEAEKYGVRQGVDVKADEKLTLHCDAINDFDSEVSVTPEVKTFERSSFGKEMSSENNSRDEIKFNSKERKSFAIDMPLPSNPQAYEVRVRFVNDQKEFISNEADVHYVLSGLSATIQNISLDKKYYQVGDKAKISFFWSGSADSFFGSRLGNDNEAKYFVDLSIQNNKGKKCADDIYEELNKEKVNPEIEFAIKTDCQSPTILAKIKDADGNVLDENRLEIQGAQVMENQSEKNITDEMKEIIIILSVFVVIATLLIVIFRKAKSAKMLIFILAVFGTFFVAKGVDAAVLSGSYRVWPQYNPSSKYETHSVVMTINLNKTSYNPNESMTASASGFSASCSNSYIDYALGMRINGAESKRGGYYIYSDLTGTDRYTDARVYAYSANFTAPSSPGSYYASFFFEDKRCKPSNYGGRLCYFDSNVYVVNKTSQINYNTSGASPYGTNWTIYQVWSALKAYGGIYKHYSVYHTSENVWGCMANCSTSELAGNVAYTVVSAAPTYVCSGSIPSGYTMCPGDDSGLSSSLSWHDVGYGSSSCTATKCEYYSNAPTYNTPSVHLSVPSPVILNSSSNTPTPTPVTLTWYMDNVSSTCLNSTGSGCSCALSGDGINASVSVSGSTGVTIATAGNKTFTLTCTNPSGVSGTDSGVTVAGCNAKEWYSDCDKQCGEGHRPHNFIDASCNQSSDNNTTCNLGDCPIQVEYQEVAP